MTFEKLQVHPWIFENPPVLPWTLRDLRKPTSPPLNLKSSSKTHQSSLTLKGGSTAFPKPLSPQGTGDVPTALLGAQTASLYGWRTIRGLRQQRSCVFLCGDEPALLKSFWWERRDTMQEDYGTTLLIHLQYYTKTDSPHYNTSSDTYQFFGKSYFGSSKPIALHLSKLEWRILHY